MPASLYNLANRKHHAEINVVELSKVETVVLPPEPKLEQESQVLEIASDDHVDVVNNESSVVNEQETQVSTTEDTVETSYPEWDASWSKAQLLTVAQSLNLPVTSINTKSEIVSALTAATQA